MKMKHKKPVIYALMLPAAFALSVSSCTKNILDTVPQTYISSATAFSTPAKILAQVNALYSQLQNQYFYGGRYLIYNEQRGDEFSQNDPNAATGALIWDQNALSTTDLVNDLWSAAYTAINSSNILIQNLSTSTVISDSLRQNYIGEAKFVRALAYFSLIQTYARPFVQDSSSLGLPLRLKAEVSQGDNNLARSSVGTIYSQILQDLNDAETGLPASYASASLNSSRAHKSTAIALKTRVYLTEGNYKQVVTEASKLVPAAAPYSYTSGTVTHKLEPKIATVFSGSYTGPEAIFFVPFGNATETPGTQSALAYNYVGEPILSLNPAGIVSNPAFAVGSGDARLGLIATGGGQQLLEKFPHGTAPFTDAVPVIRYAEVLLNYAEAAANNNDLVTATALLYAVRGRSNPSYVFPSSAIQTQSALISTILTERRVELLGEGFRTPDLERTLQPLPSKSGAAGTAPLVPVSASNYIWPIPSSEISANQLCQQNP